MERKDKINLILMNDVAYVWTSEDWLKIRSLRIVGNFIGSLAALPRQDQLAGLPLALLKEETTLLMKKGYAVLKSLPKLSEPPSEIIKQKTSALRQTLLSEQAEKLLYKRKRQIESKIDVIIEGKKAKKKLCDNPESSLDLDRETVLQEEFNKIQPPKTSSLVVQIPTTDPWLQGEDLQDCAWNYPTNIEETLRYLVFEDLWEKEYFITPGGKFGGDFLVYPGDPVKFHAYFIVICVDKNQKISMNEIITYGRLGQSVKKTVTLAYVDVDSVIYQSIKWAGF